jgi:diguanylate cyclase (GGDEF)-like protein
MEKENQILLERSETDPLTQLSNRLRLNDYSEEVFADCVENQMSLAVEILDIDDFKGFNDTYGHQTGDECLVKVAQILKTMEEEHGAFVARYGGDEFMLIYTDITKEQASEYAEELRRTDHLSAKEAAFEAVKRRMRPVFLTSVTTALGVLPMILAQTSLWMPMGVVICFGTMLTLPLTLTVLPVLYWKIYDKK